MSYAKFTPFAVAAAIWVTSTGYVHAQTWDGGTEVDVPRAVELESAAETAIKDHDNWSRAASLFRDASHLRPGNDTIAFTDLRMAGAIFGTMGDLGRAKRTMVELADRAIVFGEVETAAHAFLDAAHVAAAIGDPTAVRTLYERAQRLSMSSHLTGEARERVAMRLDLSTTVLASSSR